MATKTTRAGRGHGFTQVLEWSAYKHKLLSNYLHVWCYKLGAFNHELAFVDTCAGAGKYEDEKDGSPLIAAKFNGEKAMVQRGTGITVYAFETDGDIYPQLVTNLAPYTAPKPPRAHVSNTSFFENPRPVLDATREVPTLFLIDPFGTVAVTKDHLHPLLTHADRASTEVLVRIDPTMLARFAGWVRRQSRSSTPVPCAASFARLLERLNIDTEQIAEEGSLEGWGLQQDKYELLEQYLRLYTNRFHYVQVVPIRASYQAAPKYMLVHGSDSAHGAAHLNDCVSTLEDRLFTATYERRERETGQGSLFGPPQRAPRYSEADLDAQTFAFLEACGGDMEFIELRAGLAMHFGPDFREKHHRGAVKRLIEAGRVESLGGGAAPESDTILRVRRIRRR
ncbi:MAG: three-Cys-motif partner protein TcmP [Gemmatimonadaceae bacterium]